MTAAAKVGKFGWYTMRDSTALDYARVVQVGWVVGRVDIEEPTIVKQFLVKPCGYEVSEKATKNCHGITHERAVREGRDLAWVLQEFMKDVSEACAQGGRVCAHQLERAFHSQPAACAQQTVSRQVVIKRACQALGRTHW